MTQETHLLFSTPIFLETINGDDFNSIQFEISEAVSKTDTTDCLKNVLGWGDTVKTSFNYDDPTNFIKDNQLNALETSIHSAVEKFVKSCGCVANKDLQLINSWINFYKYKDYQNSHYHADSLISGCYYYDTNGKDGNLAFENPNPVCNSTNQFPINTQANPVIYEIQPRTGMLVLFPSWLRHRVNANKTNHTRISIAFNLV